jgi:outer membrane lipoprotein-sorting protein
MKNFMKFSLTALALMFFLGAISVTETSAQGPLAEVLQRMDAHNKALSSLRASIKMEKYNSQLKESDVTEGTAMYLPQKKRDAFLRIDWTKPNVESLAVVNKEYVIYRPGIKWATVGKLNSAKDKATAGNALAFINMSRAQLKANYTIRYVGVESVGGTSTWHLELTPKAKTSYKTADLWVDKDGMPIQAKVLESNNDTTTVQLSGLEKNVTLNTKNFSIDLPKDTKIVK